MEQVWHVYHGKVTLPAPFDTCMEQTVLACLHSTWKYARMHTHVQYNVHTYTYMYYRCTVISTYPCTYPVFDMVRCYHVHAQLYLMFVHVLRCRVKNLLGFIYVAIKVSAVVSWCECMVWGLSYNVCVCVCVCVCVL